MDPAQTRNERIAAAIKEAVEIKPPATEAKPPATEAKPPTTEVKPPATEDRSFEKLAKEKAALRAEAEQLKPVREILKALDPGSLAVLAKAKQSGDPLAALSALGFSYSDVANRMLDLGGRQKAPEKKAPVNDDEPEAHPDVAALKKEVEELKRERAAEQATKAKSEVLMKIKETLKPDKFRHVVSLGEHDAVLQYLEEFYRRTGSLPAEEFEESIALAAAAVEKGLEAQAAKWGKFLTPGTEDATLPTEGTRESPSAGQGTAGTTLTNATSPNGAAPKSVSREEKLKALLADPTVPW